MRCLSHTPSGGVHQRWRRHIPESSQQPIYSQLWDIHSTTLSQVFSDKGFLHFALLAAGNFQSQSRLPLNCVNHNRFT